MTIKKLEIVNIARQLTIDIERQRQRGTDNIFLTAIWGIICDNLLSAFATSPHTNQMNAKHNPIVERYEFDAKKKH